MNKMYHEIAKTWNPFVGCRFNCVYCDPSFKKQAKRQKQRCHNCYQYIPHFHPERLKQYLPQNSFIFCCDMGDISFASYLQKGMILAEICNHNTNTFLLQTKNPDCFTGWKIPPNVIVGTTIETNRITNAFSDAPSPVNRYFSLQHLNCRKAVTIEPIMDFDMNTLVEWIGIISPEICWVGYNNYPNKISLPEPSLEKTKKLIDNLQNLTDVRIKTLRETEYDNS